MAVDSWPTIDCTMCKGTPAFAANGTPEGQATKTGRNQTDSQIESSQTSSGAISTVKALVTFTLLALLAVTGEAASSAWEDDALDLASISSPLLSSTTPEAPPDDDGFTLIIVGPDPDVPPLPPLDGSDTRLVQPGDLIPEPTSGLLLLVGSAMLLIRRQMT